MQHLLNNRAGFKKNKNIKKEFHFAEMKLLKNTIPTGSELFLAPRINLILRLLILLRRSSITEQADDHSDRNADGVSNIVRWLSCWGQDRTSNYTNECSQPDVPHIITPS